MYHVCHVCCLESDLTPACCRVWASLSYIINMHRHCSDQTPRVRSPCAVAEVVLKREGCGVLYPLQHGPTHLFRPGVRQAGPAGPCNTTFHKSQSHVLRCSQHLACDAQWHLSAVPSSADFTLPHPSKQERAEYAPSTQSHADYSFLVTYCTPGLCTP